MRSALPVRLAALAGLAFALAACDETTLVSSDVDAGPRRCLSDEDCPERTACNVSTGVCFALDACGPEDPCPEGQVCTPGEDGFRRCVFERCASDAECAAELECPEDRVASCQAGACVCGVPCSGGCPGGEGCCIADDTCYPLPERCMGMTCPLGQQLSVTATGAWSTRSCMLEGEACACEPLPPLREGDIGLYASLVQPRRGRARVAAYNRTWGDLMVGELQPDRSVAWAFVDGVPTSTDTIGGDLNGPRGGQAAAGRDVGWHASATLAGDGETLFVAYQDRDAQALRFAVERGGAFTHHLVDDDGDVGLFAHAGLGAADRPFVVYLARAAGPAERRASHLRLARASSTRPASSADWTLRDLVDTDLSRGPCVDRCRSDEVCVLPAQRCERPDAPGACSPSCGSDQACVRGRCRPIADPPLLRAPPEAAGLWPSAALGPDGTLHVAYFDARDGGLFLLRIADGGAGAIQSLPLVGGGLGRFARGRDAGRFVDLAVDAEGRAHLAYLDRAEGAARYIQVDAAGRALPPETVESGLDQTPRGLLGADISLVLGPAGPIVAYQDQVRAGVRLARRAPDGAWTAEEVPAAPGGGEGFYVDLVPRAGGGLLGVSYRFALGETDDANGVAVFELP